MKIATRYFLMAALVAAPITAAAQTTPPPAAQGEQAREGHRGHLRGQRGPGMGGGPLQRILAQRERLNLTDAQVQRLEGIQRDLQARNEPLVQQLRAAFPERADGARRGERPRMTEAQRQQMQQRRAQMQPVMQQLRENTQAAFTQARAVLTAEQQAQVNQWRERRGERGDRRDGRREGRRGERGPRGGGPAR